MTRREQLQEQYEDALFALMMDDVATAEGKKYLEENERLKNDPDAAVPEEISRECLRTIRRQLAKRKARAAGRVTAKVFGRVAMVAGVAAMLFTAVFATSETVRVNTMNLVVKVYEECTDFYVENGQSADTIPEVTTGWLPEGYILEDHSKDDVFAWYLYQKSDNESIKIKYTLSEGLVLSVDTEDAAVEHIEIHGAQAMLITKGDVQQLVWLTTDKSAFIQVLGIEVSRDELIHVAQELRY